MLHDESSSLAKTTGNHDIYHVEVALKPLASSSEREALRRRLQLWLDSRTNDLQLGKHGSLDFRLVPDEIIYATRPLMQTIRVVQDEEDDGGSSHRLFPPGSPFQMYMYELSEEESVTEEIEPSGGGDEWTAACDNLCLPHISLDGLWENLIFESSVKQRLLQYAESAILFSDRKVSEHIVNWNRILLLHGVPGTGKTSLCRALAHKLSIRLSNRFPRATLLEIHSHSLFSKWFSTSGKLVSSLFSMVRDMVEDDPESLVCVLIDEIESLASVRGNTAGGDPSDAMRAVNSLLTSLDRLKSFPNVLVLATTNLTGQIDAAFVDRVDLKIHIGLPILRARYEILRSCLEELMRVGILFNDPEHGSFPGFDDFRALTEDNPGHPLSRMLKLIAEQSEGMSGRSLRRLPLQAHAQRYPSWSDQQVLVAPFLAILSEVVTSEQKARCKV